LIPRESFDPAGLKRRDIGPAVGDQLPEESARMKFSRTTVVYASSPSGPRAPSVR
jgi:hypothetical protein